MKIRPMLVVVALVAVAAGAWLLTQRNAARPPVSGTVEADEARVASRTGGRVAEVLVNEGDAVHAGQVLVRLEAAEWEARRAHAAASLAELESGPRTQEVAAARATWEALRADLDFARVDARRKEELARQKSISESERDVAVARARSLEQQASAAEQRHAELEAGTRPERVAQARAQVAELDAQVSELQVRSPGACTVELIHVKPGDVAAPNAPVATLLFQSAPWVRVYVPEPWLGHVRVGMPATVSVDAFPGRVFTGQVEQVSRQAEFTPRNVQTADERVKQVFGVKVRLPAADELRPGMAADVRFPKDR